MSTDNTQWITEQSEYRTRTDEALKIGTVEVIKADLRRLWEVPMRIEGLGVRNPNGDVDVSAEIDSLYHYTRLQTFYDNTDYDVLNRQRIVADFCAPYYSNWGLNRAIIPSDSFVKDILKRASLLYQSGAVRTIADEATNTAYHEVLKNAKIGAKSKQWHRMLKLHDTVAVRPVVRMHRGKYILTYDVKTPDQFRVIMDDYGEIEKFMYPTSVVVDGMRQDMIVVWTNTQHYMVDVHGKRWNVTGNNGRINPYKQIPFVVMTLTDSIYSGGAYGLLYSNMLYNFYELLTNSDANSSALNVFVSRNLGAAFGNDPFLRPSDVLNVESDDSLSDGKTVEGQFLSAELYADRLRDLQTEVFKTAALRKGIPPSFLADTVQELSGKAMRSAYRALLEEKLDDADTVREYEKELAVMTAIVSNYHTQQTKLPRVDPQMIEEGFYVDFNEQDFGSDDPNMEFELEMTKVEKGIVSVVDVIRKHNPDINSDEEALRFYEKNKALLQKFTARGFSTTITTPPAVDAALR